MTPSTTGRGSPNARQGVPAATSDLSLLERVAHLRRWLRLHRRVVSALLAFVSVYFALKALAPAGSANELPTDAAVQAQVEKGLVEVPLRLSDPAVAELLNPGDIVDVLGADVRGPAAVVAAQVLVTDVPDTSGGSAFSTDGDGLVVVAATSDEALALAGAASQGPLSIAVHP